MSVSDYWSGIAAVVFLLGSVIVALVVMLIEARRRAR